MPDDDLYDEIERRAFLDLPEEDAEESVDLVDVLREDGGKREGIADLTLGGYIELHDRAPAFEGSDGQPYTVAVDAEASDATDAGFVAFLVFIRWAATGAGIMDHCESGDLAVGETEEEARANVMELTLYEVKTELDAAIERRRAALEE